MSNEKLAIYIHYPYCLKKCPYCDFNSYVNKNPLSDDDYYNLLTQEITHLKSFTTNNKLSSLYFGGGTPSLMNVKLLEKIIKFIDQNFKSLSDAEITLEANPSSTETQYLKEYKKLGINRLSVGVQSFNDKNLQFLGRVHDAKEAIKAINEAKQIYDNLSFDLIYSLPKQNLKSWERELSKALEFNPNHISLYQLTIEPGTIFENYYNKGNFSLPDDDTSYELYEYTHDKMQTASYEHYEISNFAKKGYESRHNLNYWQYNDYLGAGPGAHSRLSKKAIQIIKNPKKWAEQIKKKNHAIENIVNLSNTEIFDEMVLMAMRNKEGLNTNKLKKMTGRILSADKISELKEQGLIEMNDFNQILKPTFKGMCLYNYLITSLV